MPDRAKLEQELERLRNEHELQTLRDHHDSFDSYARGAADNLNAFGATIAGTVGQVARKVDQYTGAPVRAAIGAAQEGKPIGEAFTNQFLREPETAPSGKDIAARAGFSTEPMFDTGFYTAPNQTLKVSPAGAAGAIVETVADPTLWIPGRAIGKGVELAGAAAESLAPKIANSFAHIAEERAVKATTGQNVRALRDIAGTAAQSSGDIKRAQASIDKAGRTILDENLLSPFDRSESLAPKLAGAKRAAGEKIGEIGKAIDERVPNAVSTQNIATEIAKYADSFPDTPTGAKLKDRLYEKAAEYENLKGISFSDAQFEKNQFKYKHGESDALISNQDISNKLQSIISKEMENTASTLAETGDESLKALLSSYGEAKGKYRTFKLTGDAATDRSIKNLSNRFISPSDYGIGGIATVAGAMTGGTIPAVIGGMTMAAVNKVLRERGSAFAARAADAISETIKANPGKYEKWGEQLGVAANNGSEALVLTHHMLMNNDPAYAEQVRRDALKGLKIPEQTQGLKLP